MFQTGSQINPALGRVDYSAYTQGAVAGGQSIGQGIANLGQSIAGGIEQYVKKKEAKKELDDAIIGVTKLAESNPDMAAKLGITAEILKDPQAIKSVVKSVGGPAAANSMILQFAQQKQQYDQSQAQQQLQYDRAQAEANRARNVANDAFKYMQTGKLPAGDGTVLSPQYADEVIRTAYMMGQQKELTAAQIESTKADAIKKLTPVSPNLTEADKYVEAKKQEAANRGIPWGPSDTISAMESYRQSGVAPKSDESVIKVKGKMAEDRYAEYTKAQDIPTQIERIDRAIDLLDKGELNVGVLGEAKQAKDKVMSIFGNEKAEGRVKDTELFEAALGQDLIDMIKAAGLTTRSFDTKAEMDNLRQAYVGGLASSPAALKEITLFRRRIVEKIAEKYNKDINSGYFKVVEEASGRPLSPIAISPYSPAVPQTTSTEAGNVTSPFFFINNNKKSP